MSLPVYTELSLSLAIATVVAFVMKSLKQPLVVAYILAGILVGPTVFNLLHSESTIELFSKIGITILLFIVGLGLNPQTVKEVGKVSLITGIGQVVFTSLVGFGLCLILGLDRIAAIYVAIALTFSSTIIILKLLSDKGDVYALYGKIAIGFLLVQDIIATLILLVVSLSSTAEGNSIVTSLGLTLAKGGLLLAVLLILDRFFTQKISHLAAKSTETLFLFAITWGLGLAGLFQAIGFSIEIGALVAGIMLSTTPYSLEIATRLQPLRDFFIVLFFILLGATMNITEAISQFPQALILSLFVLVGNPIIVIVMMNILGYDRSVGFKAGLTVAQISEFSLILATLGLQLGHIPGPIVSLITLVGLITIATSTYLILYADHLYPYLERFLSLLELRSTKNQGSEATNPARVFVFGYNRIAPEIVKECQQRGYQVKVIDVNPEVIKQLQQKNILAEFGDANNPEFLHELSLTNASLVISTLPDHATNCAITSTVSQKSKRAIIIPLANQAQEALELYSLGATYVITPHFQAAKAVAKHIKTKGMHKPHYQNLQKRHHRQLHQHLQLA